MRKKLNPVGTINMALLTEYASKFSSLTFLLSVLVFLLAAIATGAAQNSTIQLSTPEQFKDDFVRVPCKNEERLHAVRTLFERAGAPPDDVVLDKLKNVENLVITKRGASSEKIVIGAHYDRAETGCGALDNWTGIVTLAHLYRTVKDVPLKKTLIFVAFGKEEPGLIGSRAMVNAIDDAQLAEYCAMVNVDTLGLGAPQVGDNMSSKKLGEFASELAKQMKMPFGHARIDGADSDSSSFLAKKIPAVTIHGMTSEWRTILHTSKDQASRIDHVSVYLGYRLVLALIARLDQSDCGAYK